MDSVGWPQSNQRGIETRPIRISAVAYLVPGLNRTSVGLKRMSGWVSV